ncbi:MAG: DMT family transporter [Burkholderiaceae bacterium]
MNPGSRGAALSGMAAYFGACVFWGMNVPLTTALFDSIDPFWLAFFRQSVAMVLMASLLVFTAGASQLKSPIALWRVLIMSLCISSFFICYNLGLQRTNTITAAAIMAGSPVYGALVGRLLFGVRLERGFWGAMTLTVLGAGIAIWGRAGASGQGLDLRGGEILIVLAYFSWATYTFLSVRWFPVEVPQLRRTYLTSIGALPWLLSFFFLAQALGWAGEASLPGDATAWTYFLLTAVFSTATGPVLWNVGVSRLGVNAGMMWQNTVPVFAVLIAAVFFGVTPLPEQIIGGLVVMAGVLYMQWARMKTLAPQR